MKRDSNIKFTKFKLDTLIDIKLDTGVYVDSEDNDIDQEVKNDDNSPPRRCFSKKDIMTFVRELLKINPNII